MYAIDIRNGSTSELVPLVREERAKRNSSKYQARDTFFNQQDIGPLYHVADFIRDSKFSRVSKKFHEANQMVHLKDRTLAMLSNKVPWLPLSMKDLIKLKKEFLLILKKLGYDEQQEDGRIGQVPIQTKIRLLLQMVTIADYPTADLVPLVSNEEFCGFYSRACTFGGCLLTIAFGAAAFSGMLQTSERRPGVIQEKDFITVLGVIGVFCLLTAFCCNRYTNRIQREINDRRTVEGRFYPLNEIRDLYLDKMSPAAHILRQKAEWIPADLPNSPSMDMLNPAISTWFQGVYENHPELAFY